MTKPRNERPACQRHGLAELERFIGSAPTVELWHRSEELSPGITPLERRRAALWRLYRVHHPPKRDPDLDPYATWMP